MNENENLQNQINELKRRLDNLNASQSIPLNIDLAFNKRGFLKENFFVAGIGTYSVAGEFRINIPGATRNSIVLTDGNVAELTPAIGSINFGDSTSQFDITNPAGDTFRYTWDGTGTDPGISAATVPTGSKIIIFSPNFNPANQNAASRPFFIVTGSGANYFEIDNFVPGVAENNVTIGAGGSITGGSAPNSYDLYSSGTALSTFNFAVLLFKNKLYVDPY